MGDFEKIAVNLEGEPIAISKVATMDPLTIQFDGTVGDVFSKLVWIADGDDFQLLYDSRVGWPAIEGTSSASETFSMAAAGGALYVTTSRKLGTVARNEGFIGRYENGVLVEYATRAREALSDGSDTAFSYNFVRASSDGALSLGGSDGRFPHFIVRATEGSAVVLAQENVTNYPGTTEKFTRFNPQTELSADGSAVAFRGETASRLQGLCLWTEDQGIQLVADSTMNLPGSEEPFNTFLDSSILCSFGPSGELYMFNSAPKAVVVYQAGSLSPVIANGDSVAGAEVKKLGRFDVAPSGDLFAHDNNGFANARLLRFKDGEWSVFQPLNSSFDVGDGNFIFNRYWLTEAGVYFVAGRFDPDLNQSFLAIYLKSYEGGELVKMLDVTPDTFGVNPRIDDLYFGADDVVILSRNELYRGRTSDFTEVGNPNGGGDPSPDTFEAFATTLPESLSGAFQDADGDVSNLVEYALGIDASVPNGLGSALAVELKTGEDPGLAGDTNTYAFFKVRIRDNTTGVTVTPLASSDLGNLNASSGMVVAVGSPMSQGDGTTIHSYRSTFTIDSNSSGFMTVSISLD